MAKTAEQVKTEVAALVYADLVMFVKRDQEDIQRIWEGGTIESLVYEALGKVVPDSEWIPAYDKLQKGLEYWKQYEQMFKAEYSVSSIKFVENLGKEDLAKLAPHEALFVKGLGSAMGYLFTVLDMQEGRLEMYMKSPTKLVVRIKGELGTVLTNETCAEDDMTDLETAIQFLERMRVKMIKRPVYKRVNSCSLYD